MDSIEGTPMPDDVNSDERPVAFRELRTVIDAIDAKEKASEQRRKRTQRDRRIGWALTTVLIATTLWLGYFQYRSETDLRRSLYETCVVGNASNNDTAAFYRELSRLSRDPNSEFMVLLKRQITRLEAPRDCAGKYL